MSYVKQNFVDGEILNAEQMNHIEDGIVINETVIAGKADASETETIKADLHELNAEHYEPQEITTVTGAYYNSVNMAEYASSNGEYAIINNPTVGATYKVFGRGSSDVRFPCVALFAGNVKKQKLGTENATYNDSNDNAIVFEITSDITKIIINGQFSTQRVKLFKYATVDVSDLYDDVHTPTNEDIILHNRELERVQFDGLYNKFDFSPFDKGYVTFIVDDGRPDIYKSKNIFSSKNAPLCVAIPPSTLSTMSTSTKSVKDICNDIVSAGGEVLAHGLTPITLENFGEEILKEVFRNTKLELENNGFHTRGIIGIGGSNAIKVSDYPFTYGKQMDKWCRYYYDYSDAYGLTKNYSKARVSLSTALQSGVDSVKQMIADNNGWICFYYHAVDSSTVETNVTTSVLNELLDYCNTNNYAIVTPSYIYDRFSSNEALELAR